MCTDTISSVLTGSRGLRGSIPSGLGVAFPNLTKLYALLLGLSLAQEMGRWNGTNSPAHSSHTQRPLNERTRRNDSIIYRIHVAPQGVNVRILQRHRSISLLILDTIWLSCVAYLETN